MSMNGYKHTLTIQAMPHDIEVVTDKPTQGVRSVLCVPCNQRMRRTGCGRYWRCEICGWMWLPRLKSIRSELERTAEALCST